MTSFRLILAIVAVSTCALVAQSSGPVDDSPVARGTIAFRLADRALIPESIGYDPTNRVFYVGSMYKRKIIRIGPDGQVSDFVPSAADGIWSVLGIKVDPSGRELWANACNLADRSPPMMPDDPATRGHGGLFRFDLQTGRLIRKYTVGWAMAPRCFNDLAFTPDGSVYLSSGPDGIYRIAPGAERVELFSEYPSFINGIATSDEGRLLVLGDYRGAQLMDIATRTTRPIAAPAGETLGGIDGLYIRGQTLVAVQNGLRSRPARVIQAELTPSLDRVTCVAVLDRNRPEFDIPTTGVLVGNDLLYVASSQLRRFNEDKTIFPTEKLTESVIIRTPLQLPCGQSPR
jgi:sugar lactone lactonase YvrE